MWCHLPAMHITLFSEVGSLHGDLQNVYPSLPLFADNTCLGQGLSDCLTKRTSSIPPHPQDSCCTPSCITHSNCCPVQQRNHSCFCQYLSVCGWGDSRRNSVRRLRMLQLQLLRHDCPPQHILSRMGCRCFQAGAQSTSASCLVWAHIHLHVTSHRTGSNTWKIQRNTLSFNGPATRFFWQD